MKLPELKEMMEAGMHFGHMPSKWNPKMSKYIFGVRNNVHIFDLEKTIETLARALGVVKSTVANGGVVLFLGTKKQARWIVEEQAKNVVMPYIVEHWIGGTITNFVEIHKLVKKLEILEKRSADLDYEKKYTKWERSQFAKEIEKLNKNIGGIRYMKKIPDLVYIVGIKDEKTAVAEARAKGVKTVGIVDTNADPDDVTYPIAANDDAIKSITMITKLVAQAVEEGKGEVSIASAEKPIEQKEKNN
ncbi:30S ribosomal protein S2 [Candidatus Kuenenbacteria bacterium CG11_big_fil_rev_8_21_14_0_20_37_9]|uniref:Small ribosomal subunit protein uS2 n=2 Tax=Candidatus Kueneniibacteriota TaxID=1752740 RepID=A0A2M6XRZ7_9BACT|nr:MAG: 30S ribosomal protein S2 [Candidatus Kuenenbacteria bacterium CG1_02_38_13]PIR05473.1 MAG: 30S ribosomal protein S2 [Candidatus Kuenenbacteria bacterium CG11_big_fil_rev_8_21_14_0_20_37_9]PIU10415.1 MAG: 30S ribosomal protein S2 [Candidatus Kuenenbacteria bacterium CG08_land_8_20_14_0_20_37_23]